MAPAADFLFKSVADYFKREDARSPYGTPPDSGTRVPGDPTTR
ncbi:hypothetical protein [Cystobacter fuscus]